ncbi:hypothetical protein [Mucilaginibacter paludis]|uniref:Uncharacterized protein n=1 Tax=Mucilaginibacter paludis DSM 18603 TaxID=714943 RepID=H1YBM3_9SPHI|nr:hypothetical protein [Mucilaginibacter paludis]EHQ25094.1 hypothetical protein Mucpa_0914 [Mucilaginibacter paludis DSM 18603]
MYKPVVTGKIGLGTHVRDEGNIDKVPKLRAGGAWAAPVKCKFNKEQNVKKMKNVDAAKIKDMAAAIAAKTMLAAMVVLCIRFIRAYMAASVWCQTISVKPLLTCTYARKRVVNRVTRDRKFALFTKNPNSRAGLFGIR